MSQRKPGYTSCKCDHAVQVHTANKGLAPSTRQQAKQQTKTRPISDYTDKRQNFTVNERFQQKHDDSNAFAASPNHRHRPPNNRGENVTFVDASSKCFTPDDVEKQNIKKRFMEIQKQNLNHKIPFHYHNQRYNESISDTETEIESQSFEETDSESTYEFDDKRGNEETPQSIHLNLQKGLSRITNNYVFRVKSHVDEAMSKLKLQEKPTQKVKQVDVKGAGDIKPPKTEELHKKMDMVKKECYRKIEANIRMLKNIDNVTDEIFFNYANANSEK